MSAVETTIKTKNESLKNAANRLLEMEIHHEVNRIPFAELIFSDGNPALQKFAYSDLPDLAPGEEISVQLAYVGGDASRPRPPAFTGIIVRHAIEATVGASFLSLEVRSKAYKMTQQRKSRVFANLSDSDIFRQIIKESGLTPGTITETQPKHIELVQYNCSDWDFLLSRADSNGLWVVINYNQDGQEFINILAPRLEGSPAHTFAFGASPPPIYHLKMQADLSQVNGKIQSVSWDSSQQQMTQPVQAKDFGLKQGKLKPQTLAKNLDKETSVLVNPAELKGEELKSWANAQMIKSRLAFLRGTLKVKGQAKYQLSDLIAIKNTSEPFNGNTLITAVRHYSSRQSWKTDIQFGLGGDWFTEKENISGLPAAGLVPPIGGLRTGTIEPYEKNAQDPLLIKVKIPDIDENQGVIWARLGAPYAGNGHGFFFRPEAGDEVVIGFINDDPREAIVLGSLYSSAHFPPVKKEEVNDKNQVKALFSRQGLSIKLDEEKGDLQIASKDSKNKENIIHLTHDSGNKKSKIEIKDANNNKFVMDDQGILIESPGKIVIKGKTIDVN